MRSYKNRIHSLVFILMLILSCALLRTPIFYAFADEVDAELGVGITGDVNKDGKFDLRDISALFHQLNDEYDNQWDLNEDGVISLIDVYLLYQVYSDPQGL